MNCGIVAVVPNNVCRKEDLWDIGWGGDITPNCLPMAKPLNTISETTERFTLIPNNILQMIVCYIIML